VAFRNAASTLVRSQSYLGAQYRRLRNPPRRTQGHYGDGSKARVPLLLSIKHGQQSWISTEYYEARYRDQQIRSLVKRDKSLNFNWLPHNAGTKVSGKGRALLNRLRDGLCTKTLDE
jgi:hypothetical protein